jgi:hypothetical protein
VKCRAIARTTHPVGPCGRTAPAILLRVGRGTLGVGPAWGLEANTAETASAQRIISRAAATIMWKRSGGRMTTGPSPRRPEATRLGTPKLPPSVPRTREAVPPPTSLRGLIARKNWAKMAIWGVGVAREMPSDRADNAPGWSVRSHGACNPPPGRQRHFRRRTCVGFGGEHGRNCTRTTHNQPRGGDNNLDAARWPHGHRPPPPAARSHPARHPEVAAVCATHTRSCASPNTITTITVGGDTLSGALWGYCQGVGPHATFRSHDD